MAPRERDQRVAIRTPQRCDHVDVVTTRTIERIGEGIGIRSDPIDLLREQLDRFDETCITAQLKQSPVKIKVAVESVSYTHLRAHETRHDIVCRLLLEKKKT